MLPVQFVYLGALISLYSSVNYCYSTVKGRTQPNRVTWFFWALVPLIATAAQLKGGVGLSTLAVFMTGFSPLLIFIASFVNRNAYWRSSPFDYACGAFAALGVIGWLITHNGNVAIGFSIVADFCAALPTLRKAWTTPESENGFSFFLYAVSSTLGLMCVQQWRFTAYGFISYLALICIVLCVLVNRQRILRVMKVST